jgi:hypothetical protein
VNMRRVRSSKTSEKVEDCPVSKSRYTHTGVELSSFVRRMCSRCTESPTSQATLAGIPGSLGARFARDLTIYDSDAGEQLGGSALPDRHVPREEQPTPAAT